MQEIDKKFIEAVEKGDMDAAKEALAKGADVLTKDKYGAEAWMAAAIAGNKELSEFLKKEIEKARNSKTAQINPADMQLIRNANTGKIEQVKDALAKGANVNAIDEYKATALMEAARGENVPEIIKLLLEKGADANMQDERGRTALMLAATEGKVETVKLLLKYKANANIKTNAGKTAVAYANDSGNTEVIKLLKESEGVDSYELRSLATGREVKQLFDRYTAAKPSEKPLVEAAMIECMNICANNGDMERLTFFLSKKEELSPNLRKVLDKALVDAGVKRFSK
ncbi:MAG: ankyrin repeat domain-containing protein [Candidatus Micrarchaeota archaeon]